MSFVDVEAISDGERTQAGSQLCGRTMPQTSTTKNEPGRDGHSPPLPAVRSGVGHQRSVGLLSRRTSGPNRPKTCTGSGGSGCTCVGSVWERCTLQCGESARSKTAHSPPHGNLGCIGGESVLRPRVGDVDQWQSAILVAAIAAVAGIVGAAIGRERWPADLRDAKRLGEIVEKMEPGSQERDFAAQYRDDLASRWIIGQVAASNDIRREIGLSLMIMGLVLALIGTVGAVASLVGVLTQAPVSLVPGWAGWIGGGLLSFALGVWSGNAYLKRWDRHLKDLRAARGMREPITSWVNDFNKARLRRKPAPQHRPAPEPEPQRVELPEQNQ